MLRDRKRSVSDHGDSAVECGLQNGTLAIAVAMTVIGVGEMAIPGAIYSLIMFFTGGFFMFYFGRRKNDN